MSRGSRFGIDLFIEDRAYTTFASAVSILVVLTLVFSTMSAVWSMSRAGDAQACADTTALAGVNVVSSYHTAATVVDASILSLGLAGFCTTGAGLVGMLIPGAQGLAGETVDAGIRMIKMRNDLATSASRGMKKLEGSLPFLIATNSARLCAAQGGDSFTFTGVALACPRTSASEFPAIEGDQIDTDDLENSSDELDEAAKELAQASERTASAKEAAWIADCGRAGMNMRERAGALSNIPASENPNYASSITWNPTAALDRTRAYYRCRLAVEASEGSSVEAQVDSAARKVFYEYAIEQFRDASVTECGGHVTSTMWLLPKNTEEMRKTKLLTDARWPTTTEDGGLTLHFSSSCPGAAGPAGPRCALSDIEEGRVKECATCKFNIGTLGRTPAASTSIDNGFEYHLREFTLALDTYVDCRNHELELERKTKTEAESAENAFEEALSKLAGKRPRIAPPGRNGCLALVVSGEIASPDGLERDFSKQVVLSRRGAISAAVLAPDKATDKNNLLSEFFSSLRARTGGGGAIGLIDDVMGLWGKLLIGYGDLSGKLSDLTRDLIGGLSSWGLGPIADWLGNQVEGAVRGLGLEPVDLSPRKPVLTDSGKVIAHSGMKGLTDAQDLLRSIPLGTTDPAAIAEALSYEVGDHIDSLSFTIAEIPLPGGGSIPLTIRLRDIGDSLGPGS